MRNENIEYEIEYFIKQLFSIVCFPFRNWYRVWDGNGTQYDCCVNCFWMDCCGYCTRMKGRRADLDFVMDIQPYKHTGFGCPHVGKTGVDEQ